MASSKIFNFARTYFREWAVLQFFTRIYFRESAMLRIFVNIPIFTNQPYWDILRVLIFANRLFSVFRGYLFWRIRLPQTFREDLISRIWPKFAKINPIKVIYNASKKKVYLVFCKEFYILVKWCFLYICIYLCICIYLYIIHTLCIKFSLYTYLRNSCYLTERLYNTQLPCFSTVLCLPVLKVLKSSVLCNLLEINRYQVLAVTRNWSTLLCLSTIPLNSQFRIFIFKRSLTREISR